MSQEQEVQVVTPEFSPREAFLPFHARSQSRAILVVHRRGGKTVSCVIDLVGRAMASKKSDGRYAYIGPYANQTIDVVWDYLKKQVARIPNVNVREAKKQVRFVNMHGLQQTISLYGADKPDRLRGLYFDGVVLDEVADMKSSVWSEVVRPALMDRKGWAVFIGTPKGKNFFYKILKAAEKKPEEWFSLVLPASKSKLLKQHELDSYREEVDEDTYNREMECSFDASTRGSIWGKEIREAEEAGRMADFDVVMSQPVHLAMDIGRNDATAAWFFQLIDGEVRIVDFGEWKGSTAHTVMPEVLKKGYRIGTIWMPHDGLHGFWVSERNASTVVAQYVAEVGGRVKQVPKLDLEPGIQAARHMLKYVRFAGTRCYQGIESLKAYRRVERADGGFSKAVHDDASHPADAFRYLCLSVRDKDIDKSRPVKPKPVEPMQVKQIAEQIIVPVTPANLQSEKEKFLEPVNVGWTFNDFMKPRNKGYRYTRI